MGTVGDMQGGFPLIKHTGLSGSSHVKVADDTIAADVHLQFQSSGLLPS